MLLRICEYNYYIIPIIILFFLIFIIVCRCKKKKYWKHTVHLCLLLTVLWIASTTVILHYFTKYTNRDWWAIRENVTKQDVLKAWGTPYKQRHSSNDWTYYTYIIHVTPMKYGIKLGFKNDKLEGHGVIMTEYIGFLGLKYYSNF